MDERQITLLFQGDSITDGGRGRSEDLNHVFGHGYVYLLASRLGFEYPGQLKVINRGISANRVLDLYGRWEEDALRHQPDWISLLIGVNDVNRSVNTGVLADRYEKTLRLLLDETREVLPHTRFILCEPFIGRTGVPAKNWEAWDREIRSKQETVRRLAEEYGTLFVPLQEEFDRVCEQRDPEYWLWDGVHPTAAGHELIARQWAACVQDQLGLIR